jgi:hypothetical protein
MKLRREHPVDTGFYIVFGSIKRPSDFFGGKSLDWSQPPIGVYQADTPEEACQAAARDHGQMATYFAVGGTPWGVDLIEAPARQLGRTENSQDRMNRILDRMEKNDALIDELKKQGPRELTPAERVAAAEARSAEMEQEAGIFSDDDIGSGT